MYTHTQKKGYFVLLKSNYIVTHMHPWGLMGNLILVIVRAHPQAAQGHEPQCLSQPQVSALY